MPKHFAYQWHFDILVTNVAKQNAHEIGRHIVIQVKVHPRKLAASNNHEDNVNRSAANHRRQIPKEHYQGRGNTAQHNHGKTRDDT